MDNETFQRHARGLLERLRIDLELRGANVAGLTKSSEITGLATQHGDMCNPDAAKRTGAVNAYDELLSAFSSDLYNLMMNFAIRNLPEQFDQLAMVMRNAPAETPQS